MCPQVQQQTESPRIIRDEGRAAIAAGRGDFVWGYKKELSRGREASGQSR